MDVSKWGFIPSEQIIWFKEDLISWHLILHYLGLKKEILEKIK